MDQNTNNTPTAPSNQPTQNNQSGGSSGSGGSKVGLIIVIVVLVLIILGIGGYFLAKNLFKKAVSGVTATTQPAASVAVGTRTPSSARTVATGSTATTGAKMNVQVAIDAVKYPNGQVTDQTQDSGGYVAKVVMSSSDSVDTIKAYYNNLITKNGWKVTRQSSSGANNYYLEFSDVNFDVELDITRSEGYDTTDIDIRFSGGNITSSGVEI